MIPYSAASGSSSTVKHRCLDFLASLPHRQEAMITIELRLPVFSLVAFFSWVLAVPPVGLAFHLAFNYYVTTSLKVAAGMLSGFLILAVLCTLLSGAFPQKFLVSMLNLASNFCVGVIGLYWLACRIRASPELAAGHKNTDPHYMLIYETIVVVFWFVYLMVSTALGTYSLLLQEATLASTATPQILDDRTVQNQSSIANLKIKNLAINTALPHSPQFSFDSSPSLHIDKDHPSRPLKSQTSLGSLVSFKRNHRHNKSAPLPPIPSLEGLEGVPQGFADMDWEMAPGDASDNIRWILAQAGRSRDASGSTQRSGSLFSAADYNRRINDAGFVTDEPVPQSKLRHAVSHSQYDQERHRQSMV